MPDNNIDQRNSDSVRFHLGTLLPLFSIGAMCCLAGVVLYRSKDVEEAKYVFNTLLPLLGTWVGTVLAYYFSRDNFEAASNSVRQMAKQLTPQEKLQSISVKDKMIPLNLMVYETLEEGADVNLTDDILEKMKKSGKNRLPIFNPKNFPLYIIHRSRVDRFLLDQILTQNTERENLKTLKLTDLLKDSSVVNGFEVVGENATLAEAKEKMDKCADCLDVFVTKNGSRDEAVIGWLTNIDIVENARV